MDVSGLDFDPSGLDFSCLGARFWTPLCLRLHAAWIAARDPSWHSLKLFFSYLQRGGTCAAHPPPPEGRAERVRPWGNSPSIFMHQNHASDSSLKVISPILCSFPRTRTDRHTSSAVCFWGLNMRFFRLPKFISFFASIVYRKNWEKHACWPPETTPKPS